MAIQAGLPAVVSGFEDSIKKWIANNIGMINFSHPQYSIRKISDRQYDITLSLTGMGVQHFSLMLDGDKFTISGKIGVVGSGAAFPVMLLGSTINMMLSNWVSQTIESLAVEKARMATMKASRTSGKPVNAIVTLLPDNTTTATMKTVKPKKRLLVSSTGKVTEIE